MLSQNIKNLRKQKGYTQETFAQELNIVRQTVSKWEKGYSVPDAIMLEKIAEFLEVSVGDLLSDGEIKADEKPDLKEIADQLSILNNQYAKEMARRKRNRKIALIVIAAFFVLIIAAVSLLLVPTNQAEAPDGQGSVLAALIDPDLDEVISKSILEHKGSFTSGECGTESHFVFGTKEDGNEVTVYLLEDYTEFGFKNGFFTDVSGWTTPVVLTFEKRMGNEYKLLTREAAGDGAEYVSSIKKLFPRWIAKRILAGLSDEENEAMWENNVNQAKKYLYSINREATICQYAEIKTEFISDHGVEDEIVNKITEMYLDYDYTIGNHERIEDGKRYVYQTGFDDGNGFVTFTKFEYESGKIVEFIAIDGEKGEIVKDVKKPEMVRYYEGELDEN